MIYELSKSSIDRDSVLFLRRHIINWGRAHFKPYPWRTTRNKWHALVAEVMLQRTNADQVLGAFIDFRRKYPTAISYVKAGCPSIFSSLGLHWRSSIFPKLASAISSKGIPKDTSGLIRLPGVGPYIAAAFLSMHTGTRAAIIDSNIVRLYGRFFGFNTNGETRREKWFIKLAESITPRYVFRDFNYGLLDFTRAICKPQPLCFECPLKTKCRFAKRHEV